MPGKSLTNLSQQMLIFCPAKPGHGFCFCNFHANIIGMVLASVCKFCANFGQKIHKIFGMVLAYAFASFGQKIDKSIGMSLAIATSVPK
jgi:hypothetical protein